MRRVVWSRSLLIAGVLGMLVGALDPLEGSVIILVGAGLVALAGFLVKSRYRLLLYGQFGLVAFGVGAMFTLSAWGGIGGDGGRSSWWWLAMLPYPAGWIMGLAGAVLTILRGRASHEQL